MNEKYFTSPCKINELSSPSQVLIVLLNKRQKWQCLAQTLADDSKNIVVIIRLVVIIDNHEANSKHYLCAGSSPSLSIPQYSSSEHTAKSMVASPVKAIIKPGVSVIQKFSLKNTKHQIFKN